MSSEPVSIEPVSIEPDFPTTKFQQASDQPSGKIQQTDSTRSVYPTQDRKIGRWTSQSVIVFSNLGLMSTDDVDSSFYTTDTPFEDSVPRLVPLIRRSAPRLISDNHCIGQSGRTCSNVTVDPDSFTNSTTPETSPVQRWPSRMSQIKHKLRMKFHIASLSNHPGSRDIRSSRAREHSGVNANESRAAPEK